MFLGGQTYEESVDYIKKKYLALNHQTKSVFMHETCAIDIDQMSKTTRDVQEEVLRQNLAKSGFG